MNKLIVFKTARGPILWYMNLFDFDGWASLWNTVYLRPGFENSAGLKRHEAMHIEQMARDGKIMFMLKYTWWLMTKGYWDNPYEVEAREAQKGVL